MVGGVTDVITCAKFQIEIFMGYDFTGGRIFDFCIDKCKKNCCFITMCKAHSKITHIKQQQYFHHLKGRGYNKKSVLYPGRLM